MLLADTPTVTPASDLVAMLRRHYLPDGRPPGGILATEIEAPGGLRRADAIWAPWSIAGGDALVGHEVKVTRADVVVELADPMKAEPWARFCSRWWLVVASPTLVSGLDVPDAWGIMAPPSGRRTRTMTVVRPAPRLKPVDTGDAWRRIATWDHGRLEARARQAEWESASQKRSREWAEAELRDYRAQGIGRTDRRAVKVAAILAKIDEDLRSWPGPDAIEPDEIAAAIVDLSEHRRLAKRARDEVAGLVAEVRRLAAPMRYVADELEQLANRSPTE